MLRLLPLILIPGLAAAVVYWLTGRRAVSLLTGAVVLGVMLYVGVTS